MAYLNGIQFEHPLINPPGRGELNFDNGYKAERLAGQHMPGDGWYWLAVNYYTVTQTKEYGSRIHWWLVECRGAEDEHRQLRRILHLAGSELRLDWYDFSQAHWVGPVAMPQPPEHLPTGGAQRL